MAWLTGWSNRKKITIDHNQVDGALTDFPVYVHLDGDTDVGGAARSDGYDIRFTSSDGETLLKYEREYFNIAGGSCTAHIWVKVPSVSAVADTEFFLYYGKADAGDGEDAANVWDASFEGVYHLNESFLDSTVNSNDGVNNGSDDAAGVVRRGRGFVEANTDYIDLGIDDDGVPNLTQYTLEAWVKAGANDAATILAYNHPTQLQYCGIGHDIADHKAFMFHRDDGGTIMDKSGATTVDDDAWHHVAAVRDGDGWTLYVDGSSDATDSQAGVGTTTTTETWIGGNCHDGGIQWFDGSIDEVRISATNRSAAWIDATHCNISTPTTFYSWGSEEMAGRGRGIGAPIGGLIGVPFQG